MAQVSFQTIIREAKAEVLVSESKFIGLAKPVNNEKEAMAFVKKVKEDYFDASHVCYAFSVMENIKTKKEKSSDAGEPQGTAGKPILEILKNKNIRNTIIVVVRYFGGTLLGTAGLIKAYSQAAEKVIIKGGLTEKSLCNIVELTVNYNEVKKLENYCAAESIKIIDVNYEEDVIFIIAFSQEIYKKQLEKIEELLSRKVTSQQVDSRFE